MSLGHTAIMKKHTVLKGKIVSGVQKAAGFTGLDWVQAQCVEKLGFSPYPGTLNLSIVEESLPDLEAFDQADDIRLTPPDLAFCEARVVPVTVHGIGCAVVIPEEKVRCHQWRVIEILAPMKLKRFFQIDDGDCLEIDVISNLKRNQSPEGS